MQVMRTANSKHVSRPKLPEPVLERESFSSSPSRIETFCSSSCMSATLLSGLHGPRNRPFTHILMQDALWNVAFGTSRSCDLDPPQADPSFGVERTMRFQQIPCFEGWQTDSCVDANSPVANYASNGKKSAEFHAVSAGCRQPAARSQHKAPYGGKHKIHRNFKITWNETAPECVHGPTLLRLSDRRCAMLHGATTSRVGVGAHGTSKYQQKVSTPGS